MKFTLTITLFVSLICLPFLSEAQSSVSEKKSLQEAREEAIERAMKARGLEYKKRTDSSSSSTRKSSTSRSTLQSKGDASLDSKSQLSKLEQERKKKEQELRALERAKEREIANKEILEEEKNNAKRKKLVWNKWLVCKKKNCKSKKN